MGNSLPGTWAPGGPRTGFPSQRRAGGYQALTTCPHRELNCSRQRQGKGMAAKYLQSCVNIFCWEIMPAGFIFLYIWKESLSLCSSNKAVGNYNCMLPWMPRFYPAECKEKWRKHPLPAGTASGFPCGVWLHWRTEQLCFPMAAPPILRWGGALKNVTSGRGLGTLQRLAVECLTLCLMENNGRYTCLWFSF